MYLSIMNPEIRGVVADFPSGLLPVFLQRDHGREAALIIKASKELILTAAMNMEFAFYLAPCVVNGVDGFVLISAFFDDADEPLVIRTPLIAGDSFNEYFLALPDQFEISFFDEHNRELLSCRATADLTSLKDRITASSLLPKECLEDMFEQSNFWFGNRSELDDDAACLVELIEELFPSEFLIYHIDERHDFQGSLGFSQTQLRREGPGPYQELDIIFLLQRVFPPDRILHGPLKVSDGEEMVDVLVWGDEAVLLIQAKDSPNTEKVLRNKMFRKRAKSKTQLTDGFSQLGGAITSIRRNPKLKLRFGKGDEFELNFSGRQLIGVVVVKELFSDTYEQYSEIALEFMDKYQVPPVFFDYTEFSVMVTHCPSENELLGAFHQVFSFGRDHGQFPRLRFPGPPPKLSC